MVTFSIFQPQNFFHKSALKGLRVGFVHAQITLNCKYINRLSFNLSFIAIVSTDGSPCSSAECSSRLQFTYWPKGPVLKDLQILTRFPFRFETDNPWNIVRVGLLPYGWGWGTVAPSVLCTKPLWAHDALRGTFWCHAGDKSTLVLNSCQILCPLLSTKYHCVFHNDARVSTW